MQKVDDDDCAVGNKKKFISSWLTTAFSGMSINSSERKSMLHERKSRGHIPHTFRWVLCNHFLETRESCYGHRYCWSLSELYNMKPAVVILFDWWKTLDSKLDTYQTFFGERYVIATQNTWKQEKREPVMDVFTVGVAYPTANHYEIAGTRQWRPFGEHDTNTFFKKINCTVHGRPRKIWIDWSFMLKIRHGKALRMSIKPNTESKASYFIAVRYISWILF